MHFDPSKKLDDIQIIEIIRKICQFGEIIYSSHVKQRIIERGYTNRDIIYILKHGRIVKKEFDQDRQNWKYTFQCEGIDGIPGAVVTAILDYRTILLVTVLGGAGKNE